MPDVGEKDEDDAPYSRRAGRDGRYRPIFRSSALISAASEAHTMDSRLHVPLRL